MGKAEEIENLSPPPAKKDIARLIAIAGYSAADIRAAYKSEEAVRMEIAAFVVIAPPGFWLGETNIKKVLPVWLLLLSWRC